MRMSRCLIGLTALLFALGLVANVARADAKSAWRQIEDLSQTLDGIGGRDSKISPDQKPGFMALLVGQLEAFLEAYPDDQRAPEARVLLLHLAPNVARGFDEPFDYATWFGQVDALRDENSLLAAARVRLEALWITYQIERLKAGKLRTSELAELLAAMEAFVFEHRKDARSVSFALLAADVLVRRDPERAETILQRALKNVKGKDPRLQNDVEQSLAVLPYRSRPIDLSFKAADGSQVDLAAMKGKVIVVDFWASWCPPCRHESPELVELYHKYRADGLEIVGVSLDESRKKMQAFSDKVGMDWPHYFDGRGWRNKISTRFAISSIPSVWVIDRDGYLVNYKARGKLDQLVPRLLAKPLSVAQR